MLVCFSHNFTGWNSIDFFENIGEHSGVPRNFVRGGGGVSTNSVEDRENGDLGGGSPLVRGSEGSCNLVQEISFHIVKFS